MLETTLRAATETRTAIPSRAQTRPLSGTGTAARLITNGSAARAALPSRTPAPAPRPTARRRAHPETRLLTVAIGVTMLVCALLVVYLAAYAHVTLLGIDQSQARVQLRQARLDNETLRATLASLQSPDHVTKNAVALGMTTSYRHVDYIQPGNDAPRPFSSRP